MASEPYLVQRKKHPLHKKAGARWKKCRFPRKSWKITYMITLEKAVHTICWIFLQPFIQYYLSKTASKSWQYHTLMVLQSSAKSCTPSKPRVNIVSSSVMNIWPFVTTLVRKETKYLIIQFGTLPSIGNARNPERDNCSLESTIKSFQCCTWEWCIHWNHSR